MATIDILLPTYNRLSSFIMTLTGVPLQTLRDLHLLGPDQSHQPRGDSQVVQAVRRMIDPGAAQWERWQLHRAANLYHVSQSLLPGEFRLYKVAWIASCILYDRAKLLEIGGFSFWSRLPRYHSGEEVLVQNLLMRRWGGCAIMPSGTYYSQVPTTVLNNVGTVDGHALDLLAGMIEQYVPETIEMKANTL